MRRALAFLVLAIVLAAAGCASNTPNANSPGTTTYNSNTASGAGAPATTGAAPSSASNANHPNEGGIKPPTSK